MFRTVAAVVHGVGEPFSLEEVDLDAPRPDEVRVRLVAAGLCHTDLSVRDGVIPFPLPGVLGHEGAGVVEEVGSAVQRVQPGDLVLLSFTSCGRCANCRAGHPAYCVGFVPQNLLGGQRADGSATISQDSQPLNAHFFGQSSLARHALVDERSLVKVPADTPLDVLAPLGCGTQTGAGAILNILRPEPGSILAVFGAGGVGMAAIMAAALVGLERLVVVDLVPERLTLARELGATDTINPKEQDPVSALRDLTGGLGVNYSVEASGNTTALSQAIMALAPLGTCAVIGAPKAGSTVAVEVNFLLNGRRIVGVTEGDSEPERFIPTLVNLHAQGRLPIDKLIRYYPFEQIEQAASDAHAGTTVKPVLRFDQSV